jgi:DNA-binding CsgD family transcriptional regulator
LPQLSPIEQRIVRLIAANQSTRDIASELGFSVRTVENRRNAICEKLGLRGANALLKFALEHKADLA